MAERRLLDAQALGLALELPAQTIHNWASAGHIARHGHAARRTLYDLDEVSAYAATRPKRSRRADPLARVVVE